MIGKNVPSFSGLRPSSRASSIAKRANRSEGLKSELLLRNRLKRMGLRFQRNSRGIRGKPDIVFQKEKIAIFCDGDYWHGNDWERLRNKLAKGWNSAYWIEKIKSNRTRDKQVNVALSKEGWQVLRFWESDIVNDVISIAKRIQRELAKKKGKGL